MKRIFYAVAIFIFISFVVIGAVLNYLTYTYMEQATEDRVKRDLEMLAVTSQGALARSDYERVEEQVFLWGELEPHIVSFEVVLNGDIQLVKFARETQASNVLHLTHTVLLPNEREIAFLIEYDLTEHNKNAAVITVIFLSMSCCIAVVIIFLLWRILQNLAFIPLNREIAERKQAEEEILAKSHQLRLSNQQLLASEQQLKASNEQLVANERQREKLVNDISLKNEELQSIVYIASHDLKSPLVNITGFSAMLDENCKNIMAILKEFDLSDEAMQRLNPLVDEEIPESLGFIFASAKKMKMLLDGLLQVSRIGSQEVGIKTLDMNKMVYSIMDTFAFQIKEQDISVTIEELPACKGDEKLVNQVFSNLINNAIKYFDPERKGSIKVTGKVYNNECIYCVEDNGIGISKDHQGKVFELFHRLNPGDSTGGQGLGLTIAKRALRRNDGRTWVESEPGKGSKFFVSLPNA